MPLITASSRMVGDLVKDYLKSGGTIKKVPPSPTAHLLNKDRTHSHVQAHKIKRNR